MIEIEKTQNVSDFIPAEWLNDPSVGNITISIYSSSIHSDQNKEDAKKLLNSLEGAIVGKYSVWYITLLEEMNLFNSEAIVGFREGRWHLLANAGATKTIPVGDYIFLIAPDLVMQDGVVNQEYVLLRKQWFVGALTLVFGLTAAYEKRAELIFCKEDLNKVSYPSNVIYNSPVANIFQIFSEAINSLKWQKIPDDVCERMMLSLKFISKIPSEVDEALRFAYSWIALETVCGSHAKAKNFIGSLNPEIGPLRKRLIDTRNALFHHGIDPKYEFEDERFLLSCIFAYIAESCGVSDDAFSAFVQTLVDVEAAQAPK